MMPGNVLSTTTEFGAFLPPDYLETSDMLDYELGGIGINNATAGLQYQIWTMRVVPTGGVLDPVNIVLSAPNTPAFVLFSLAGISEASFCFDQNMQPFVAFVQNGNARFRWYDATLPGFVITDLPIGSYSPKCSLDDKRSIENILGKSDIIIGYINNDNLYMRMERDRYTVEHFLYGDLTTRIANPHLERIGMNNMGRLQFLVKGNLYA